MGTWGTAAWENDAAADWFGSLFAQTGMAERVGETLENDRAAHEEWRAAASILASLGRVYVWPVGSLDRHLRLAIRRLEEIETGGGGWRNDEDGMEWRARIETEIAVLSARLRSGEGS
ncbi:MAG: hypothetical protein M3P49_08795 [Actinomycetota bacterium]|nr:hypothetical protein [Actinomycetota bacterium]